MLACTEKAAITNPRSSVYPFPARPEVTVCHARLEALQCVQQTRARVLRTISHSYGWKSRYGPRI